MPDNETNIEENNALSSDEDNQKATEPENQAQEDLAQEGQENEVDPEQAEADFLSGFDDVLLEHGEKEPENNAPKVDPPQTELESDTQTAAEDPPPAEPETEPEPTAQGVDPVAFADLQQIVRTNSCLLYTSPSPRDS